VGGPRAPDGRTGGFGAEELLDGVEALLDQLSGCCGSFSGVLSASSRAKSPEAFPWISRALRCLSSCSVSRSFCFFRRSISLDSGESFDWRTLRLELASGRLVALQAPVHEL
jgi:hypothetical protein